MISQTSLSRMNIGLAHMRIMGTEITHQSIQILSYLVLLSLCALVGSQSPEDAIHRRFEYKYSFKGPHIVQKDNSIPFWEYSGSKWGWLRIGREEKTQSRTLARQPSQVHT